MLKDCLSYKLLLTLDEERFFSRVDDVRYRKLRAFLEMRLKSKYGIVYPRITTYGVYLD